MSATAEVARPYVTSDNYVFPKDNDGPGDRV